MLFIITWARLWVITPCCFHCSFVITFILLIFNKREIYIYMFVLLHLYHLSISLLYSSLFSSFLKFENFLFPCFFLRKFHNCFMISAMSLSTSSSSSSLSIWRMVLDAKFLFGFFSNSFFFMVISWVISDLMSSSNESLVRFLAYRITITFVSQVFGKDLRVLLIILELV